MATGTLAQEDTPDGQIVVTVTYNATNGNISAVTCTKPAAATPTLVFTDTSTNPPTEIPVDLPAGQPTVTYNPPGTIKMRPDSEGKLQFPYDVSFG